jgi:hypothetical protein
MMVAVIFRSNKGSINLLCPPKAFYAAFFLRRAVSSAIFSAMDCGT